ncbi:hypothetical protein EDC19_0664 [Natranaerovirga hydrolytica]|uniref:BofC-like protein n=1 Tax=Natranaerovirga hydrolytica TaxID=680378 RepID=A0A4R1N2L4_9FIRM|nr:hypothetical protein [Natranaerovirga hydrolytica]TCK98244.1 hypothetical protein EDC19_0664 [Natranaerovirga hydrolytica]
MKKKFIYPIGLLSIFILVFIVAYQVIIFNNNNEFLEEEGIESEPFDIRQAQHPEPIVDFRNYNSITVDSVNLERITPATKLVMEYVYKEDDRTITQEMIPPFYLQDLTREQVEQYTKDYLMNPTDEDINKSLDNFELLSFSSSKVVLRKVYASGNDKYYSVYIDPDRNVIVIENPDGTIREDINAHINALSEEEQEDLKKPGRKIYSEEELVHFIENYSS